MPILHLDLRQVPKKRIVPLPGFGGRNPAGTELRLTNYYLERDGRPILPVMGEFQFSRHPASCWETELRKVRAGGVRIVATYLFWIHHEETEGVYDWTGDRDLRRFVSLCAGQDLLVFLRIGPFVHGECRNGGLPDWLYGRPHEVRSNDEGYLGHVRRFYGEIGRQTAGLFFKDGGPIVGIQLENEYMCAGAPWEITTGQTEEFVPTGRDGAAHMRKLKEIALASGLEAPLFAGTGWGGSPILPGEILPMWGGYAFWPWIISETERAHPPTGEYVFRNYHDNDAPREGADPSFAPEDQPFVCCELGGGMQCWYRYRFVVPPESVPAGAVQKLAGGCNWLGYYIYHGGSNPVDMRAFQNERTTPKVSYDFQAPIGEFGQARESYHRLRLLHLFLEEFGERLCPMATVLPAGAESIAPANTASVRYAARAQGGSGFLFLNNYQDHAEMLDHEDVRFRLDLPGETLFLPRGEGLALRRGVSAVLPFNLALGGVLLKYATAQPITRLRHEGTDYHFFHALPGFACEYRFAGVSPAALEVSGGEAHWEDGCLRATVTPGLGSTISLAAGDGRRTTICTLPWERALGLHKLDFGGRARIALSDADYVLPGPEGLELFRAGREEMDLWLFPGPDGNLEADGARLAGEPDGLFTRYRIRAPRREIALGIKRPRPGAAVLEIPPGALTGLADVLLRISYRGDTGCAFIGGRLIADHFNNGEPWEIGLSRFMPRAAMEGISIHITPLHPGRVVFADEAMAARCAGGESGAEIDVIEAVPVYSVEVTTMAKGISTRG